MRRSGWIKTELADSAKRTFESKPVLKFIQERAKFLTPSIHKVFEEFKILQLPVLKSIQERSYRALGTATYLETL